MWNVSRVSARHCAVVVTSMTAREAEPAATTAEAQFRAAIAAAGLRPPDDVIADGKLHRFATNGRADDDGGWYVFHADGIAAGSFGDWRTGVSGKWRADRGRGLSYTEKAAHRARVAENRKTREAEEACRHTEARREAVAIWNGAKPACDDHAYLRRKHVGANGLRVHDGQLIIPIRDGSGLQSLQFIDRNGRKLFLDGGRVKGGSHLIGTIDGAVALCLCEGYATGATVHAATNYPVEVAFNAGNLLTVAEAVRNRHPELLLIICADDDINTPGNPGLTKATEAARAVKGLLAVPDFGADRPVKATDFNDLMKHRGIEAVAEAIMEARAADDGDGAADGNGDKHHVADTDGLIERVAPVLPVARPEMFFGLAGDVVRAFEEHTEADPAAIATQFLVAFGNAIGRGPHMVVGETIHHFNENLLVVGTSSRARKGDSGNIALRSLREADPDWSTNIASGLSSGEGLIHAVRDPVHKLDKKGERIVVDEGADDKRLLVVESEFSTALKQFSRDGNVLSNVLRDAWDSKCTLRTLTKNSPTRATGAHISVIAHTTPADLAAYLSSTEAANGLGNRFMCVLVHRAKLLANPGRASPAAVDVLVDGVRETLAFARTVGEMRRTPAAAALWGHIYPTLTADRPGLLGQLLARSEAHVTRLSALYALSAQQAEIDVEHLEAALALWDYIEASTEIVFGDRTGNEVADRIRSEMAPGESLTLSEIRERIFADHISSNRLSDAIKLLVAMGDCRVTTEPTGGRPSTVVTRAEKREKREKRTFSAFSSFSAGGLA